MKKVPIDRKKQAELKDRAKAAREDTFFFLSMGGKTYDPQQKRKQAWVDWEEARRERNKK